MRELTYDEVGCVSGGMTGEDGGVLVGGAIGGAIGSAMGGPVGSAIGTIAGGLIGADIVDNGPEELQNYLDSLPMSSANCF